MIQFAKWLADTNASLKVQEILWIIPIVQCIHILAISTVIGAALMINLRILNVAGVSQSMTATSRRFIPWIWWGVSVALATGLVMIVGEPVRELVNFAFWGKMALLFVSLVLAGVFQSTLNRRVAFWETNDTKRHRVQILAVVSILIWVSILVLGRLIAYLQIPVD
ncbi:MAG: DUF6644 family protein [Janthinobacterium lividum]